MEVSDTNDDNGSEINSVNQGFPLNPVQERIY